MAENTGFDKTPVPAPDYDVSKVPDSIKKRANYVRTKFTGEDILESVAQMGEISGLIAKEALEAGTYNGNSLADVTLAKGNYNALYERLDAGDNKIETIDTEVIKNKKEVETKLNQTMTQTEFDSWVATLLDGGPSIFMDTLAALQTTYPNGSAGVALVRETNPAKIYAWDGSVWKDFGEYQGLEVKDGSITSPKLAARSVIEASTTFLEIGKNNFDKDNITPGYLSTTGEVITNQVTSVSDFIKVIPGQKWHRNEFSNQVGYYFENKDKHSVLGYGSQPSGLLIIPSNVGWMRVTVNNNQLNIYQLELGESFTTYEPYGVRFKNASPSSIDRFMLKNISVSDDKIQNKFARLFFEQPNPFFVIDFSEKKVSTTNLGYIITDSIRSIPPQTIDFSSETAPVLDIVVDKSTGVFRVKPYTLPIDNPNTYLIATFYTSGAVYSPSNCRAKLPNGSLVDNFIIGGQSSNPIKPYTGKKIVFYGDSITNNPIRLASISNALGFTSYLNMGWSDSALTKENKLAWVYANGTFAGNPAAGGTQPANSFEVQSSFCHDERIAYIPTDADVVFIMGATNDFFRSKALGTIDSDNTTMSGALVETIRKIQAKLPNALLVVATPIVAINGAGSDELRENAIGLTITDYVKAVKNVVEHTGVAFSDVHQCGINLFNAKNILPDGTHPSTPKGDELISRKIIGDLKAIAPI